MWNDTAITRRLGIRYPIVQGPFGGGLSSARLVAAVSNAGGLGSFGAQGLTPDRISAIVSEILPYPLQSQLVGALREEAIRTGRIDLIALWSGQSGPLLRHRHARDLFQDLVGVTERTLERQTQNADG